MHINYTKRIFKMPNRTNQLIYYMQIMIKKYNKCINIKQMQKNITPQYFTNKLIFSSICQYLKIPEIITLSAVNHEIRGILQQHLRNLMKQLNMKPSTLKSSLHQMQFYFNRCLRISVSHNKGEQIKDQGIFINYPFKFETIHYFEVGTTFCCYLTRDQNCRIMRTAALLSLHQLYANKKYKPKNEQIPFESRTNVRQIKCKSQQVVVVKNCGEVYLISGDKNNVDNVIAQQQLINWTANIPIYNVYNSYVYTILCPKTFTNLTTIFSQIFNKNWWKKQSQRPQFQDDKNNYLICRNMQTNKQFVIEVPCSYIIDGTVGNRHAYFISNKNQLFEVDLQEKMNLQFPIVKAQLFKPLMGKSIVKIVNGYNYFVALERNIEELEDWDTDRVVKWLRDIGFQEYIKIAKFQKLDGKKLKNIQRKYMHNVLGITTQNMQQKFIMSIQQHSNKKFNYEQLWGWGRNDTGQLGSSSANVITKPQKIKFNSLQPGEHIDSIFCGWFQTFIRTQKGRIYQTILKSCKKRKGSQYEKQQKSQQQQQTKQSQKKILGDGSEEDQEDQIPKTNNKKKSNSSKNGNHKKTKKTVQLTLKQKQKQKNNRKYEEQQSWWQFEYGKAFFIQTCKQITFTIQCPNQIKEQPNKITKLRTAKAILDKILWSSVNKEQFKVGYMDKDMGLIEASALDMQKFDVKQNRIKYFKKNNTIVWDKDNKIDLF